MGSVAHHGTACPENGTTMDASDLALLDVIICEGGIIAAARKLNQPKTTISRRLQILERAVGAPLFERTGRRLRLTPLGEAFAAPARNVRAAISAAQALARTQAADDRGALQISAPVLFGSRVLVPLIGEFLSTRPHVTVALSYSQTPIDPLRAGLDLSFSIQRPEASYLTIQKLAEYDIALYATPDLARQVRQPSDLRHLPAIQTSNTPANALEWTLTIAGGKHSVAANVRTTVNDPTAAAAFAARGLGVCGLPTFVAHSIVAEGRIVPVLPGMTIGKVAVWVATPPLRSQIGVVRTFLEDLRRVIRAASATG